jgi:hypothetical protein
MPDDNPTQPVIDTLTEFHRAGGSMDFTATSTAAYAELVAQIQRESPNPKAVDAAVAAVKAAPESATAVAELASVLPQGQPSEALLRRIVALLESMAGRPAAAGILGRVRSLSFPAAKQVNLYVVNQTNHF